MTWFEQGEEEGKIEVKRRDNRTAGQRKEGRQETYQGRYRTMLRARDG